MNKNYQTDGDFLIETAELKVEKTNESRGVIEKAKRVKDASEVIDVFVKEVQDALKYNFSKDATVKKLKNKTLDITIKVGKDKVKFNTNLISIQSLIITLLKYKEYKTFKEAGDVGSIFAASLYLTKAEVIKDIELLPFENIVGNYFLVTTEEKMRDGESIKTRKYVNVILGDRVKSFKKAKENGIAVIDIESLKELHKKEFGLVTDTVIERDYLAYATLLETHIKHGNSKDIDLTYIFIEENMSHILDSNTAKCSTNLHELFKYFGLRNYTIRVSSSADSFATAQLADYYDNFYDSDGEEGYPEDYDLEDPQYRGILDDTKNVKLEDVFGLEEIKKDLDIIAKTVIHNYEDKENRVEIPKGVLFVGSPGTGKTYLTKAFSNSYGFELINLSDFNEKQGFVDSSSIKRAFLTASNIARVKPVVLFIDEIDKIFTKNNDQSIPTMLEFLSKDTNVLVIGACNYYHQLSEALIRPGRFDKKYFLGDLSRVAKISIFDKILDKHKVTKTNIDIKSVVDFLPSDVTVVYFDAIAKQLKVYDTVMKTTPTTEIALEIAEQILDGIVEVVKNDKESLTRTAWHEAAHAATGLLLDKEITLATIKAGYGHLGYVMFRYAEDKTLTYKDYENTAVVAAAGWAIEKKIYKDFSMGATADFGQVQGIVNFLATATGSEGPAALMLNPYLLINSSEAQKTDLYNSKKRLTNKYIKRSVKLVDKHFKLVEMITEALLAKEKLTGQELLDIYTKYKGNKK